VPDGQAGGCARQPRNEESRKHRERQPEDMGRPQDEPLVAGSDLEPVHGDAHWARIDGSALDRDGYGTQGLRRKCELDRAVRRVEVGADLETACHRIANVDRNFCWLNEMATDTRSQAVPGTGNPRRHDDRRMRARPPEPCEHVPLPVLPEAGGVRHVVGTELDQRGPGEKTHGERRKDRAGNQAKKGKDDGPAHDYAAAA
jgi:hypothetical protein